MACDSVAWTSSIRHKPCCGQTDKQTDTVTDAASGNKGRFFSYMLMIYKTVHLRQPKLFADDTNLFVFGKSFSETGTKSNSLLSDLNKWFLANKLSPRLILRKLVTRPFQVTHQIVMTTVQLT